MGLILYYFLASLISSTLGTLIGAGGSAILGPLLLLTETSMGTSIGAKNIIGTSLACVVANSVSGSYRYLKIGTVDIKSGLIFSIIGIPFSILAALTLIEIDTTNFKIMFGVTLILITIFMIYQSMKNEIISIKGDVGAKEILELNKDQILNLEINNQSIIRGFNTQKDFNSL